LRRQERGAAGAALGLWLRRREWGVALADVVAIGRFALCTARERSGDSQHYDHCHHSEDGQNAENAKEQCAWLEFASAQVPAVVGGHRFCKYHNVALNFGVVMIANNFSNNSSHDKLQIH
jgi:hypothetical protein